MKEGSATNPEDYQQAGIRARTEEIGEVDSIAILLFHKSIDVGSYFPKPGSV